MTDEYTTIKVPRSTRKMLENVIEAWETEDVPRLEFSFPRVVELLLLLALAQPPTAEQLKAAAAKLKTRPRGRPRGLTRIYKCHRCAKQMAHSPGIACLRDGLGVMRYACSEYCETKLREFYK